jgi:murein DD-endopeptidase MepM/ murein hydrolase activator NlpD
MADRSQHTPDPHGSGVLATLSLVLSALVLSALLALQAFAAAPAQAERAALRDPASTPSRTAQQRVDEASAAYADSRLRVEGLSAQAERLNDSADRAEAVATELGDEVADEQGGALHALGDLFSPGQSDVDRAAEAAANAEDARRLADAVQAALDDAIARAEQDRQRWETAQTRLERVEATWSAGQVVDVAIRRSQPPPDYAVPDRAQQRRNRQALRSWERYLHQVARTGVVPPAARELLDPDHLAPGLEPVQVAGFRPARGVAAARLPDGRPVTVLPVEAIRAVSDAFHRLGLAEVPGGSSASSYACGGLVANAWSTITLPADAGDQLSDLPPVARPLVQVGDVVVLGSRRAGLDETGVYVGPGLAIVADASTGTAAVRSVGPRDVLATRRPSLLKDRSWRPSDKNVAPPAYGVCGGDADAVGATGGSGPFVLPLATGSYELSAGFGSAGEHWSTGEHTGQDFAAPVGTPVVAAGPGVVRVEHPSWAGNLVRIDHGGGVETLYAHLSQVDVTDGQSVAAGQRVGAVGNRGNTTGPHLHLEVRLDDVPVDPVQVLAVPEAPRPSYPNGEMPADALCAATPDGVQQLRCDAAVAYRLMGVAFERDTGEPLCITDSYRSRAGQEDAHIRKPTITAKPGTSVHGLGLAVDLCGGVESFASSEHAWLAEHGPAYGWIHPSWAAAGGSRPEPWHFEYEG